MKNSLLSIIYVYSLPSSLFMLHAPFQADLCGIKWKKLVLNERPQATGDPLDDPVLRSYTKCLAKDILCVWRRVTQHKNDLDQTGGLGMFDISQIGNTSVIHPPLSLTAAKELWIFWYGDEPDLTDSVSPELLKSSGSYLLWIVGELGVINC
jgi:mediator of RNA polymerase II transcription subunit 13